MNNAITRQDLAALTTDLTPENVERWRRVKGWTLEQLCEQAVIPNSLYRNFARGGNEMTEMTRKRLRRTLFGGG